MEALIRDNSYFGVGFGENMTNTNMMLFRATPSGCIIQDTWSTGHKPPKPTQNQDYLKSCAQREGYQEMNVSRALKTNEA